jgi:hypothetical protein
MDDLETTHRRPDAMATDGTQDWGAERNEPEPSHHAAE